jgi:response regulator of citrate/malate metabolism
MAQELRARNSQLDHDTLLTALADSDCRQIFERLTEPKTASQIVQECDIPRSTVYRKLELLADIGFLEESIVVNIHGTNPVEYRIDFSGVEISVNGDGSLSVSISDLTGCE